MADRTSITYEALCRSGEQRQLQVLGGLHPAEDPDLSQEVQTLILLGPGEPGFWAHVTASQEFGDGKRDPLDRWSRRVIESWADELDAVALFPFGGPPYQPFLRWAQESGRVHTSPVGMLVHDQAGLMVSFRGALGFRQRLELPPNPPSPCHDCLKKPCLAACPAGALGQGGYDVSGCHSFLDTSAGADCMTRGCAVRRACPVSKHYGRVAEQSAYHMKSFHGSR